MKAQHQQYPYDNELDEEVDAGRAGVYGVVVPDLENPFFPAFLFARRTAQRAAWWRRICWR